MKAEFWNERYAEADLAYGEAPNDWLKTFLQGRKPGRLLLPAEGQGRNAAYAAQLGWEVQAMDYSTVARDIALEFARSKGVSIHYELGDLNRFEWGEDAYDAIGLIYVHLPPPNRQNLHRNLSRALKPGGFLVLEAFNPRQLGNSSGGPPSPHLLYTLSDLSQDFQDLEILEADECRIELAEGKYHSGPAEVVRLLAQKPATPPKG